VKRTWLAAILALVTAVVVTTLVFLMQLSPALETQSWPIENIYQGKTIVTGQRDETRIPGFKLALVDALKKVTGDPAINSEEVLAAVGSDVRDYVKAYSEHDRMADIPIHDEQGTRDRPFDLVVDFHKERIDELLKVLKREPWLGVRSQVLVLLVVHFDSNSYILTSDDDLGTDQRSAMVATAWQAGLPIALPTAESVAKMGRMPDSLFPATAENVEKLRQRLSVGHLMVGSIVWASGMQGWKADWNFDAEGKNHHWQIQDVNFDDAFRSAMRGSAQILSGHGEPRDGLL
jgi:uncharacterized protein